MNNAMWYDPNFCLVQDCATNALKATGKKQGGLYYLVNANLSNHQANLMGKPVHVSVQPCVAASLVDTLSRNKLFFRQYVPQKDGCSVTKDNL